MWAVRRGGGGADAVPLRKKKLWHSPAAVEVHLVTAPAPALTPRIPR